MNHPKEVHPNVTISSTSNYHSDKDHDGGNNQHSLPDYHPMNDPGEDETNDVYIVRQQKGYLSILFSLSQTVVLAAMMYECGVAPLNMNPMVGPYPDALSYWGGKNAYLILEEGENFRLVTPIMLHAGVVHLLGNVAVQLDTCAFFEREWGSIRWLIIYILSAVGSSAWSTIFSPNNISVGSSGAVMGLFGAKMAEVMVRYCDKIKTMQHRIAHEVRMEQCGTVTCSVIIVALFSFIPYVDWAAHMGGLVAGFCVGIPIFALNLKKKVMLLFWACVGTFATVTFYSTSLEYMYNQVEPVEELSDVCEYYRRSFEDYECNCQYLDQSGDGN